MPVDLEFYELYAIGRNASFENRVFHVLETFSSINTTSFEAVNITVQNRCGQRSEAVSITLGMAREFTCMHRCMGIMTINFIIHSLISFNEIIILHVDLLHVYN